jgi:hypothetical protein
MIRVFQVAYREKRSLTIGEASAKGATISAGNAVAPAGPMHIEIFRAEHEQEVLEAFVDFHVVNVRELRVELAPGQNVFELEEAAEYLRCSVDKVNRWMGKGKLPKAREGYPKFTRAMLDAVVEDFMEYSGNDLRKAA